jgi:hypothetical protein
MLHFGPGRTSCANLEPSTCQAVAALGIAAQFEKVTDYPTIVGEEAVSTPAPVVDEKLALSGRVPTPIRVREILSALGPATN